MCCNWGTNCCTKRSAKGYKNSPCDEVCTESVDEVMHRLQLENESINEKGYLQAGE